MASGYAGLMSLSEPAANEPDATAVPISGTAGAGRLEEDFTADDLGRVRRTVLVGARRAGLAGDPLDDFVAAVHELVTNAVRHGGGRGRLELRCDGDTLVCDVSDDGPGFGGGVPAAASPPPAETPGGRGLWLARQLADTLLVTDGPSGATVSVTVCLPPAAAGPCGGGRPGGGGHRQVRGRSRRPCPPASMPNDLR